jgi:allantoate deiminase
MTAIGSDVARSFEQAARDAIAACRRLAAVSDEPGWTTRTFLSAAARAVLDDLGASMARVGMGTRIDMAGNLRGVYAGTSADAPTLLIGSHLDTVPHAGAFDGILGVVLGITLVDMLRGRRLPFGIEVVGFSEEEGVRFGIPFIGSRALLGTLDESLLQRRDPQGSSVADAIRAFGLDPSRLDEARVSNALGYLELHIEQGPVLESLGLPLGVVEAIVGQTRAEVVFIGQAAHAGTTPMTLRRDAVATAAEWITSVENAAQEVDGLVATVGRIDAQPGAGNVVAGRCRVSLDVRHARNAIRLHAVDSLRQRAEEIAKRRRLRVDWVSVIDQPAVEMDTRLTSRLARAVERSGVPVHLMPSGAGHDAMIMAARMPAALLFVRSPGGVSHHPDETVNDADVAVALKAAAHFLDDLSASN